MENHSKLHPGWQALYIGIYYAYNTAWKPASNCAGYGWKKIEIQQSDRKNGKKDNKRLQMTNKKSFSKNDWQQMIIFIQCFKIMVI